MKQLVEELKKRQLTIGSCESLTAGLFASSIAAVPGASAVLKGGFITYQTVVKEQVVHVSHDLIKEHGVVSASCAKAMAENARRLLDCDMCVSFSGNAGPDVMEGKAVGTVFCGLAVRTRTYVYECCFHGTRNEIRQQCIAFMRSEIMRMLKESEDVTWKKK